MANLLCRYFKQLKNSVTGILTLKYSTSCHQHIFKGKISPLHQSSMNFQPTVSSIYEPNLRLAAGHSIIDMGFPQTTTIKQIIDNPININGHIIEPKQIPQSKEDKIPETSLDLPMIGIKIEKQAARLIVIRRRKMRKHKLRKLRKKMKFVWRKVRQRREMRREKAFHQELINEIRAAEEFDAKAYVASRIQILDHVRVPNRWKGELLPESMIRKFMKEQEEEEGKKRNRPRLTL